MLKETLTDMLVPIRHADEIRDLKLKIQQHGRERAKLAMEIAQLCFSEGQQGLAGKALVSGSNGEFGEVLHLLSRLIPREIKRPATSESQSQGAAVALRHPPSQDQTQAG